MDSLDIDKINEAIDKSNEAAKRLTSISEYYELQQKVAQDIKESKEKIDLFNKNALIQLERTDDIYKEHKEIKEIIKKVEKNTIIIIILLIISCIISVINMFL